MIDVVSSPLLSPSTEKVLTTTSIGASGLGMRHYTSGVLVLTREVGETIVIGNNVRVTVVGVRGDQARIGIDAPREVPVHRLEVFEELQAANRAAAQVPDDLDVLRDLPKK